MNDSVAHPGEGLAPFGLPGWKTAVSWTAAAAIAILFISSGVWKISDPHGWAVRLAQARVPQQLSLAGAMFFGIAETLSGVLILVPRFRRWGAILTSSMLVVFLVYFAVNFETLRGQDCSCFPWLKRVVGPGFFIGDGVMLLLAVCAGIWSKRPQNLLSAAIILGAVTVFALVSYGVNEVRQSGTPAPATIQVEGQPYSLSHGKFLLYFFNPECMHCQDAARRMAQLDWGATKVIAVPVERPQFSQQFLQDTGLRAAVTSDFETLKTTFGYKAYPFGVALEHGHAKAQLTRFEGDEPAATLRKLALVK
jgi:uncharacterized membrane protein YphA (DoxX/SURF4 family)